jgi:hypothetical protein
MSAPARWLDMLELLTLSASVLSAILAYRSPSSPQRGERLLLCAWLFRLPSSSEQPTSFGLVLQRKAGKRPGRFSPSDSLEERIDSRPLRWLARTEANISFTPILATTICRSAKKCTQTGRRRMAASVTSRCCKVHMRGRTFRTRFRSAPSLDPSLACCSSGSSIFDGARIHTHLSPIGPATWTISRRFVFSNKMPGKPAIISP